MAIIIFVTFSIACVTYFLWHWTYWRRRGVPGPLGYPIIGMANTLLSGEFPPFLKLKEWTETYGPVFGVTEGFNKSLVISDVDMLHEVFTVQFDNFYGRKLNAIHGDPKRDKRVNLFAAQGHRWKRLRTISSPTFSNNSLRKVTETVEECAVELMRHIEQRRGEIDMLTFYQEYTLDVIGRIAMGQTDSQMFRNPLFPYVCAIFGDSHKTMLMMGCVAPTFTRIFRWAIATFHLLPNNPSSKIVAIVEDAVRKRVKQREDDVANGVELGEPHDFIDLFLDAKCDAEDVKEDANFSRSNSAKVSRSLTMDEIVAQCFVFIVAGFDTTALSLSFCTHLLATNRDVQTRVQMEIDAVCGDPSISFDQLARLKYLDQVVKETLRLFPLAAPANARKCMRTTRVGGLEIEKGTNVVANTWAVHTDKSIWGDDANEFRPERWAEGRLQERQRASFISFGSGPRQCIGIRLAYMEEKMLLAHILRKYTFETGKKTQIPVKLVGRATTRPESVWMRLTPRYV